MNDNISVILNVYKRQYMLEEQIKAIKNQIVGINPENIHVWYNKSDVPQYYPEDNRIKTYTCNWNTKFWGRFTVPLLITTPYVAMFDDDILPQPNWFKNCLDTIETKETNGILGGSGVVLHKKAYRPSHKIGWNGKHLNHTERADLVGHAWFYRQEWIKYLWYEKPHTWNNGEDIMFSFLAQKYGGINTFVPPHPEDDTSLWSSDFNTGSKVGSDENASFKLGSHYNERDSICAYCIKNGWKTVNNV
jgi:hypothetical protein